MARRALPSLLSLFICVAVGGGCQVLSDTFNAGENERKQNEANRKRFHQQRLEAQQRKMEPVLRKVKRPPKERNVVFDPDSPEGIMLAEIKARMACRDEGCRSEVLQRVRRQSDLLLPALGKLMSGQDDEVITEALRLAGLFKVRSTIDAVSRTLLLGNKSVCQEAVWTLGAIASPAGVPALKRYGALEHPPDVMARVCRSLGQIGSISAFEPVETIFLQGTAETRLECLSAAARIGGPRARGLFERAAKDPRAKVSTAAQKLLRAASAEDQELSAPPQKAPQAVAPHADPPPLH